MARFQANPAFEVEMKAEPKFQAGMHRIASSLARDVERHSHHIMPRHRNASMEVRQIGPDVFVVNTDHGGHIDEWGSVNNPPYAVIRRGVRAAGLRLDESQH